MWRSVAVDFNVAGLRPRRSVGRRAGRHTPFGARQPFDDICTRRLERIKDEPSFWVAERDALRPSAPILVDDV